MYMSPSVLGNGKRKEESVRRRRGRERRRKRTIGRDLGSKFPFPSRRCVGRSKYRGGEDGGKRGEGVTSVCSSEGRRRNGSARRVGNLEERE